jgi:hypothetical protein
MAVGTVGQRAAEQRDDERHQLDEPDQADLKRRPREHEHRYGSATSVTCRFPRSGRRSRAGGSRGVAKRARIHGDAA